MPRETQSKMPETDHFFQLYYTHLEEQGLIEEGRERSAKATREGGTSPKQGEFSPSPPQGGATREEESLEKKGKQVRPETEAKKPPPRLQQQRDREVPAKATMGGTPSVPSPPNPPNPPKPTRESDCLARSTFKDKLGTRQHMHTDSDFDKPTPRSISPKISKARHREGERQSKLN